jgi:SAM-dependent methyltransferase
MDLWTLSDLATPWCIHVAVTLRVAEHISAGHEQIEDLAAAAGADPDALSSVLRQLASKGLFEEAATGRFVLNDAARILMDPGTRAGFDLDGFGGRMAHSWSTLLKAVRTGRPAYRDVFGRDYWDDLEHNPKIAESFDLLMGPGHGPTDPEVLLNPADWDSVHTVVDVGGGTGMQLAAVLRARPHLRGILVDLPRTVARSGEIFETAGVAGRATAVGQSFFDPLPAGADVYFMKSVLADWPDQEARALLARCAEAARPHGRVVILNGVSPGDRPSPELLMLVLVGGKNRSLEQFRHLAREAGLEVRAHGNNPAGRFIVECVPAP